MTDVLRAMSFETERQGYRKDDVDAAFAAMIGELDAARRQIVALQERASTAADPIAQLGDRVTSILQAAEEAAAAREADAEQTAQGVIDAARRRMREVNESVEETMARANADADALRMAAEQEAAELRAGGIEERAEAEREAAMIRQGAKDQSAALLARAHEDAESVVSQARARHEGLRRLEAELAERVEQVVSHAASLEAAIRSDAPAGDAEADDVSPVLARLRAIRQ
jgi:hypothetical protein